MSVEDITSGSTIATLDTANPITTDNVSEGDDHIRNLKKALQFTFPNICATASGVASEFAFAHKGGTVSGAAVILGHLSATTVGVASTLSVSGNAVFKSDVSVSGNAVIGGNLSVSGGQVVIYPQDTGDEGGQLRLVRSSTTYSDVVIDNFRGMFRVLDTVEWFRVSAGGATIFGDLTVSGAARFLSNITSLGNMTVSGSVRFNSGLDISGGLSVCGNAHVSGNITGLSDMTVSGSVQFNSTLDVSGTASIGGGIRKGIYWMQVTSGGTLQNRSHAILSVSLQSTGVYQIVHNFGNFNYVAQVTGQVDSNFVKFDVSLLSNVSIVNSKFLGGTAVGSPFMIALLR